MRFSIRRGFVRLPSVEKRLGIVWAASTRARGDLKEPRAFAAALRSLGFSGWAGGKQVHGRRVLWTRRPSAKPDGAPATDGVATDAPGLALRVFAADCAPVVLADGRGRALAAVHAGWRGAAKGILPRAAALLRRKKGVRPGDLWMIVGPCIRPCCYEVGPEVAAAFAAFRGALKKTSPGKFHLDLPAVLRAQALRAGLSARRVFIAPFCTVCDRRFYSFRRDKTERRLAAAAALLRRTPADK